VLGCTHYPLLSGAIAYVMGPAVTLVSSAEETAQEVYRTLAGAQAIRPDDTPPPRHHFITTGEPEAFTVLARRFLGPEVVAAEPWRAAVGTS
jgi:glutamate racemase